jgi:hypothetical protein
MALKARAHESDLRSGGGDQRQEQLQATGIDFSPLVEPYKGYGKLTLRLEQMPPRARFSAGMRAGERSWSLTPDDLNGLKYLLPDGTSVDHSVKVRVIGMERGDTLAVLDVKVAQYVISGRPASRPAEAAPENAGSGDQLARAQSAVGALQMQLSDALAEIKRLTDTTGSEQASAAIEAARLQWQADEQKRFARLEAELKAQTQQQVDDIQTQLADALRDLQRVRSQQPDAAAAQLAQARADWKAEEAQRLSSAEAEWAKQSEEKIGELQALLSEARKKHLKLQGDKSADLQAELDVARAEWKDEEVKRLARAETAWASRSRDQIEDLEAQLNESRAAHQRLLSGMAADGRADLEAARAAWKAEEMARLAQSEAKWAAQLDFLKADLAKAKTSQPIVDSEELQAQLRQIRDELQTGFDHKLAAAEADWRKQESCLLRDAETAWQGKVQSLEALLQAERAKPAPAVAPHDDRALRDAIANLQASVAERDHEFERLNKQLEAERAARRKELQELRAAHEAANQSEVELREQHAATLEQTEARWKQAAAAEVKSATARAELAESKLQDLRVAAADSARLDKEVVMLRATLSEREQELHRLQHHSGASVEAQAAAAEAVPAPTGLTKLFAMPYVREGLVGMACTVATILLVPGYGASTPVASATDATHVEIPATTAPETLLQTAVVLRNTRLRAAPGKDAPSLVRVERGTEVGVLKTQGGWTQVKFNHKTSVAEGWIENESLDLPTVSGERGRP